MGRHISDTRTMRWEIYYVQVQYGRKLFVDMLRQADCSGENLRTNIHR